MSFKTVRCDLAAPGVARIELVRGGDQNPLDVELCVDLVGALGFVSSTADVHAVVITHRGPVFCSGGDPASEVDPASGNRVGPLSEVLRALRNLGKPSICAIDGRVQGSGLSLVLGCDIALCSVSSTFLIPEPRVGLWTFHTLADLVTVCGRRHATRFLLDGSPIAAGVAAGINIITQIASGDVNTEAIEMAQKYAKYNPTAMRLGLAAIRRVDDQHYEENLVWLQAQLDRLRELEKS